MLSCFVRMVNELPPRFLFYKNEGNEENYAGKKSSLGFSQQDSKCNTAFHGYCSMKDMHASTLER